MFEVRDNPKLLPLWEAASRGETVDWDEAFQGYRSQVDWPGARYWRELAAHYSDAKVILTVRDPDQWFDSVQATIAPFLAGRGTHPGGVHPNAVATMAHTLINEGLFDNRLSDRAHAIEIFKAHVAEVQATIPSSRLLTFDVREGWKPLCEFLGCDVPMISFPKLNSSKQFFEEEWTSAALPKR